MRAADVMTRAVVTVQPNASIVDAIRLMLGQRISGLPVVGEAGELVGILTEGDLLRRTEIGTERQRPQWLSFLRGPVRRAGDYVHENGRKVEEVMTREVCSQDEEASLEKIASLMESKRIKRVPIVTNGRLVGVISRADLLRTLVETLAQIPSTAAPDVALQNQVTAQMSRQSWGGRDQVTVTVTNGVVHLNGFVVDMRERQAMNVLAENVAGVTGVQDHLDYLEPTLGSLQGF